MTTKFQRTKIDDGQTEHTAGTRSAAGAVHSMGASDTFIKLGVETIPPVTLIAARTLGAGAMLTAIILWRGLSPPKDLATWRRFLFQAGLNRVVPSR